MAGLPPVSFKRFIAAEKLEYEEVERLPDTLRHLAALALENATDGVPVLMVTAEDRGEARIWVLGRERALLVAGISGGEEPPARVFAEAMEATPLQIEDDIAAARSAGLLVEELGLEDAIRRLTALLGISEEARRREGQAGAAAGAEESAREEAPAPGPAGRPARARAAGEGELEKCVGRLVRACIEDKCREEPMEMLKGPGVAALDKSGDVVCIDVEEGEYRIVSSRRGETSVETTSSEDRVREVVESARGRGLEPVQCREGRRRQD